MATVVDICNLAFALIGDEANISSIDPPDGSRQAELAKAFYPIALNTLLSRHTWTFATKRAPLQEIVLDPMPAEWSKAYAKPSDCVRPMYVLDERGLLVPYALESVQYGDVIYTNVYPATFVYVHGQTDSARFPPAFVNALARLLASFIAGPRLRGATGMQVSKGQREFFEAVDLPRAITEDSQQRGDSLFGDYVPSAIVARA